MRLPSIRRLVGVLAALAVLLGLATTAASAASAASAAPASSVGGTISKSEILSRMKDWYTRKVPYSQSHYVWDLGHTKTYRTDCSGFADMALHTSTEYNTSGFPTSSLFVHRYNVNHNNRSVFTPKTVQTGDVFDDTVDGHAFVFASWSSDGKHFSYYNFGGGSSGVAPPEYHTGALMTASELGYENTNNYAIYRYTKVS